MAEQEQRELEAVQEDEVVVPDVVPREHMEEAESRNTAASEALAQAEVFEVASQEDADEAVELAREFKRRRKQNDGVMDPFIKPLRAHLDSLYELRRGMTNPYEAAEKKLKKKVKAWHAEQERKRREAERERQRRAEEEARKRREEEALKAADDEDEERFDAIARNMEAPVAPEPEPEPSVPQPREPEGTHYRDNWKMRLVGDTEEQRRESLKELCRAVAEGRASTTLVQLNEKKAAELAKATSGELQVPGLEAWNDRTLVVR